MRTISLRQFRDSIPDLTEPVTVQRRDKAGNFQVLGEWRPMSAGMPPVDWPTRVMDLGRGPEFVEDRYLSDPSPTPNRKAQQAKRDAILRKINRGG